MSWVTVLLHQTKMRMFWFWIHLMKRSAPELAEQLHLEESQQEKTGCGSNMLMKVQPPEDRVNTQGMLFLNLRSYFPLLLQSLLYISPIVGI